MKKLIFLGTLLLTLYSCNKETIYKDTLPQLEIIVQDNNGDVIPGAEVQLFGNAEDWDSGNNMITSQVTDSEGSALFTELEEKVYYFYAYKGDLDNAFDIAYFKNPLKMNQIKVIETTIQ